jgi:hypothetical protein
VKRDCQCPRVNHQHGTRLAYDADRCRCFDCRLANAIAKATYADGEKPAREGKVPNAGTQRRLHALNAVGHTWKSIGQRLGLSIQSVREIAGLSTQHPWTLCYIDTARKVEELYEEWWNVYPAGTAAHRARLSAKRKGFLPPLAWDDETIDDPQATPAPLDGAAVIDAVAIKRVVDGGTAELSEAEKDEVVKVMLRQGLSHTMIRKRLPVGGARIQRLVNEAAA